MAIATRKRKTTRNAPWEHPAPKGGAHHSLSRKKKSAAKARAKRAGRPYPNLVDNMRAARGKMARKSTRKKK